MFSEFMLFSRARLLSRMLHCVMPQQLVLPTSGRVLVFAPHPDDETIGCGGVISLLCQYGCDVRVVVLTDGGAGDPLHHVDNVVEVRRRECAAALKCLGVSNYIFLDNPDGDLRVAAIETAIEDEINAFRPQLIFSPSILDYHRDHVVASLAIGEVWRRSNIDARLFYYEISAPQPATHIVDISSVMERKRLALSAYRLPMKYASYDSSINGLNHYRGLLLPKKDEAPMFGEAFVEEVRNSRLSFPLWRMRVGLEKMLTRDH